VIRIKNNYCKLFFIIWYLQEEVPLNGYKYSYSYNAGAASNTMSYLLVWLMLLKRFKGTLMNVHTNFFLKIKGEFISEYFQI